MMNLRNIRLFHCLTTSLVLTGCTIERIDLGGIDTIGEVTATDTTAHTPTTTTTTTTGVHTEAPDSTCLAYKDDAESAFIPCSETLEWGRQGYCVQGPLELENPPTVCPATSTTTGTTTAESTTDVIIIPPPDGSTTAAETCTYVVENGTTIGIGCTVPAPPEVGPDTGCGILDQDGNIVPLPCDNGMDFSCTYVDAENKPTRVTCDNAPSPGICGAEVVNGTTVPFPCDTTTALSPTATPPDDLIAPLPPRETDEPDLVDAGTASIDVDATAL